MVHIEKLSGAQGGRKGSSGRGNGGGSAGAAANYYTNADSKAAEYYGKGDEAFWIGPAAERLGLRGEASAKDLEVLFQGFDPISGEMVAQNAGRENRIMGFDIEISAPKDISIVWALGGEADREAMLESFHAAARETFHDSVMGDVGKSRIGAQGKESVQAEWVGVETHHNSSRAGDPQLHTHFCLTNNAWRPDGTTGTLDARKGFDNQRNYTEKFYSKLEKHLMAKGYEITRNPSNNVPELKSITPAMRKEFSKRTETLNNLAREKGFSSFKDADQATKKEIRYRHRPEKISGSEKAARQAWRKEAMEKTSFQPGYNFHKAAPIHNQDHNRKQTHEASISR